MHSPRVSIQNSRHNTLLYLSPFLHRQNGKTHSIQPIIDAKQVLVVEINNSPSPRTVYKSCQAQVVIKQKTLGIPSVDVGWHKIYILEEQNYWYLTKEIRKLHGFSVFWNRNQVFKHGLWMKRLVIPAFYWRENSLWRFCSNKKLIQTPLL